MVVDKAYCLACYNYSDENVGKSSLTPWKVAFAYGYLLRRENSLKLTKDMPLVSFSGHIGFQGFLEVRVMA